MRILGIYLLERREHVCNLFIFLNFDHLLDILQRVLLIRQLGWKNASISKYMRKCRGWMVYFCRLPEDFWNIPPNAEGSFLDTLGAFFQVFLKSSSSCTVLSSLAFAPISMLGFRSFCGEESDIPEPLLNIILEFAFGLCIDVCCAFLLFGSMKFWGWLGWIGSSVAYIWKKTGEIFIIENFLELKVTGTF